MLSLRQSKRVRGEAGEPLPVVFKSLARNGTEFRRGQLVLAAAGPGTGKSAFTLTLALRSNVPTLYLSADSDAFTQRTRAAAILAGIPIAEAERRELEGDTTELDEEMDAAAIRFSYEASLTLDHIEGEMEAYVEVFGEYPALVVVDNVTNVRGASSEDDPFSGLEALMDYLHTMARQTQACVVALHHVTGPFNDAAKVIPLSGVKGQISRVPELVLTIHKKMDGSPSLLGVSTVKNRGGRAEASGYLVADLEFIGDRMLIRDPEPAGIPTPFSGQG